MGSWIGDTSQYGKLHKLLYWVLEDHHGIRRLECEVKHVLFISIHLFDYYRTVVCEEVFDNGEQLVID